VAGNVELPDGSRLEAGEVVIHTAKDWGLSIKSLILTNRRLFCPSDLTGRQTVSIPLTDVVNVELRKHLVGFATIVVDIRGGQQASFPVYINGKLVRSDIAAAVDQAHR